MTKRIFTVPSYYKDFKCKGETCRTCCCNGWAVTVSMKEYFDLLSLPCSKELRYKIDGALHLLKDADEERYAQILPSYIGKCPMQREDGLCGLQCECGEESLPAVCRLYPRSVRLCPDGECCLSCSCEKVVEDLIGSPEKLTFEKVELDLTLLPEEEKKPDSYDAYRKKCMDILLDRSMDLRERLDEIFLFLGSQKQSEEDMNGITADLVAFFTDSVSIGEECARAQIKGVDVGRCVRETERKFPLVDVWVEKILSNHFFFEKFPFPEGRKDLSSVGKGLKGLCLVWLVLSADENVRTTEDYVDVTGKLFRVVEHTHFYKNAAAVIDRYERIKNM